MANRKRSIAKKSSSVTKSATAGRGTLKGVVRRAKKAVAPAGRKVHKAGVRAGRKTSATKKAAGGILKRVSNLMG